MNKEMTSMAIQPILDIGLAKCAAFLKGAKKPFLVVLLVASLVTFLPQCSSGGGSDVGGNGSGDGNGNGGGDGNGNGGGDGGGTRATPIAVLYSQGSRDGNFGGNGVNANTVCSTNVPSQVSTDNGYSNHIFYGSKYIANRISSFKTLPDQLGGTSPGTRKIRILREGTLYTPSGDDITLAELIARDPANNGSYANTNKVARVFNYLADGEENHTSSDKSTSLTYWTFTSKSGGYLIRSQDRTWADCSKDTPDGVRNSGTTNIDDTDNRILGATGLHSVSRRFSSHGTVVISSQTYKFYNAMPRCNASHHVLCLARKD